MGLKKKKNVIILTICMVISFIIYQLYFFLTITSEVSSGNKIISAMEHSKLKDLKVHVRSEDDKFINENGVLRGVQYSSMLKYRPDAMNEFKCLNSEQRIPYEYVNDDYCDCEDSTDEPSTSACELGTFYCDTQYPGKQVAINAIPSSKVNDGICDCCDGSDEWLHEPGKLILSQSSRKHYRYYVNKCPSNCYK